MKIKFLLIQIIISTIFSNMLIAQLNAISYSDGSQKLNGLYGKPQNGLNSKVGVLIIPAWMGIDEHARNSAIKLSELGYHSFIADIYGEGNYPKNSKEAGEIATRYKNNTSNYVRRIQLALDQLIKSGADPEKIAVIGYCFGGTGALNAARENLNVKGVVSFHGGLAHDTSKPVNAIKPKILVCHGANDGFVPAEQIKDFQSEMKRSSADWQMIYYADAVHSFTDPNAGNDPSKGVAYNEKADKRSWSLMLQFFDELFNK